MIPSVKKEQSDKIWLFIRRNGDKFYDTFNKYWAI